MHGNDSLRLPKSVVTRFIKNYKIKLRRVQRKKTVNKLEYLPKMMTWHTTLREGLIKMGGQLLYYDKKWGRFEPKRRFNVDQVPVPFAIDTKSTYEVNVPKGDRRNHHVWVAHRGSGLEKRQCTLQVCIFPESKVRIAMIFRGSGKRISSNQIKAYHPDVDVYWPGNAWADTTFSVEWVKQTLKEEIKQLDRKEFVLFCDNLTAQVSDEFLQAFREINEIVWFGPSGATDSWQPVDCCIGRMLKQNISRIQDDWLEHDNNVDL